MSLSQQDYERLSAYIDDALDADARAALEARLASEKLLRRELESLRRLHALTRALPTYRAPRDFTLTSAMLQDAPPKVLPMPAHPTQRRISLRWLTAAAAVAVTVLFVVALLPRLFPDTPPTASLGGVAGVSTARPEATPSPLVMRPTPAAVASMPPQPTAMPTLVLDQTGTGAGSTLNIPADAEFADEADDAAMMEDAAASAPSMALDDTDEAMEEAAELESAGEDADMLLQGRSAELSPQLKGTVTMLLSFVLILLRLLALL